MVQAHDAVSGACRRLSMPSVAAAFVAFNRVNSAPCNPGSPSHVLAAHASRCAGMCCYEGSGGLCSVRLSEPLLKLRPRSDLVNTLLVRSLTGLST